MLQESSYIEYRLGPGETLSLGRAQGWRLQCTAGRIWLTETGGDDLWIGSGEMADLRRRGRTVMEAQNEGACIWLHQPRRRAPSRWLPRLGKAPTARILPAQLPCPA